MEGLPIVAFEDLPASSAWGFRDVHRRRPRRMNRFRAERHERAKCPGLRTDHRIASSKATIYPEAAVPVRTASSWRTMSSSRAAEIGNDVIMWER